MALSSEEKDIMDQSVNNSLAFGVAMVPAAKEQIQDNGFEWTEEHETYIFEKHVMKK